MTVTSETEAPLRHADRFFIDGEWVAPSTDATFDVIDSSTEQVYFRVPEAQEADMDRAVTAARRAFEEGPWPRMTHVDRAEFLRGIANGLRDRAEDIGQIWPRESGALYLIARHGAAGIASAFDFYADLARTFPFEERVQPSMGEFGLLVREPVGVVGAIIPWNAPIGLITYKIAPALLAGCTVVLKCSPEAPGDAYVVAEIAEALGLPAGVLNVVTADREVSELLVRDARVDKITFTGSTAAGQRIASICGARIARCTLELGGKSAALILDDMDLNDAAATLAKAECMLAGQVCSSLTRIVVSRQRHDELVDALSGAFSQVRVGDPNGPAGLEPTARPGRGLHRQRPGARCNVGDRRWSAEGPRPRLLRGADCLWPCRQFLGHRPRRNFWTCSVGYSGGQRRARRGTSQRHHLWAQRFGVHARCGSSPTGGAPSTFRDGWAQRLPHGLQYRLRRIQTVRYWPGRWDRRSSTFPGDQDGNSGRRTGRISVIQRCPIA
jgi:hypothetical protein